MLAVVMASMAVGDAYAQPVVDYSASALLQTSTSDFAPYFIGSLSGGRTARGNAANLDINADIKLDLKRRFSWGAGVEVLAGASDAIHYDRWDNDNRVWTTVANRQAPIWIQQLYGELKYRGVYFRLGIKDQHSALLDEPVTSGDLIRGNNARGVPGAEIGFIDFQDIPFTNGWVQIEGTVEYGIMTDDGYKRDQFNRFNSLTTSDLWYTYKRCYFRTKPSQPFSVTLGMQAAGFFAGSTIKYSGGNIASSEDRGFHFKDIFRMFIPTKGNTSDGFVEGSSLGSWDFKARYRLNSGHALTFAFQWPWEDGSGIGRRNGFDGLWGLYYKAPERSWINGAGIEYLDFTNQSGPIHWAPGDFPDADLTGEATGADDYYNNESYGSYVNYGLGLGSPFPLAPFYNLNGYPMYAHNRCRGMHIAVTGSIGPKWDYSVKYSWQEAWGSGRIPQAHALIDNSMLVAASWDACSITPGLRFALDAAFDTGSLRGSNFGVLLAVSYSGNFSFKRQSK